MMNPPQLPCPGGFLYTVRAGDTLFGIARRFGLSLATLLAANPDLDPAQNPGADPNRLAIGQQICIPVPRACPGTIHTIAAGDTLFALADRFNTTVEAILAANPGLDPDRLQIGQVICIPVPAPCPGFTYTIRTGDTLFALAGRFNTTVEAILAANPGLDPNRLQIGQVICIPVPAPCPGFTYTIRTGDTLFALAGRFNTTVEAILAANPGLDPNRLQIGQVICIPVPAPASVSVLAQAQMPTPGPMQPPAQRPMPPRPRPIPPRPRPVPVPVCPGFTYTIRTGDTLFALANRYNTTVSAILAANPGIDPNRLQIGQMICIPAPAPACPGFTYTIQSGDTLFALANRFNTTFSAIIAANPGLDPSRLRIGQVICIPVPAPACPGFIYTVAAGDTVFALARRFATSVEAILAANPGLVPERLAIGQRICIPTGVRAAGLT